MKYSITFTPYNGKGFYQDNEMLYQILQDMVYVTTYKSSI